MAILTAKEKLKILATGKATLKEINDLEARAEEELSNIDKQDELLSKIENQEDKKDSEVKNEPEVKPEPKPEVKSEPKPEPNPEPDEKDKRIAELEKQLEESQKDNIHADNSGSVVDNDTALYNIFKTFR